MYQNLKRIFLIFGVPATILIFSMFETILAQPETEPIFTSEPDPIINVLWSADSRVLTFQEESFNVPISGPEGVDEDGEPGVWYEYHPDQTGQAALATNEPLAQMFLPLNQQPALSIATNAEGLVGFTFPSPNNRYVVYATEKPVGWGRLHWPLAITDLQTGDTALITDVVVDVHENMDSSYAVHWSDNSTAFAIYIDRLGPNPRIYYVTNFTENINTTAATNLDTLSIENQTIYPITLYDISDDGHRVLLNAVVSGNGRHLFIWESQNPAQSHIVAAASTGFLAGAAFASPNERGIVYVDKDGLAEYDLETGEAVILDPQVNSTWVDRAWFSPDGKYVALYEKQGLQENNLYVIDLPAE